mgnify:CR=1 FL=1
MARVEEIIDAGVEYTMKTRPNMLGGDKFSEEMREYNRSKAFEEGAKWADKTMIDKACKWLEENIDLVAMDTVNVRSGYHEIVMMNDFERKFREAMEE